MTIPDDTSVTARATRVMAAVPDDGSVEALWADVSQRARDEMTEVLDLDALDPRDLTPEVLWYLAAKPRDYTHDRVSMGRVVADLSDVLSAYTGLRGHNRACRGAGSHEAARRLVRAAGHEHGFCTRPASSIGLGYDRHRRGPVLCGGIIRDGRCCYWHTHVESMARSDRDAKLLSAVSDLRAAADRQRRGGNQPAYVLDMLDGLVAAVEGVRFSLDAIDGVEGPET